MPTTAVYSAATAAALAALAIAGCSGEPAAGEHAKQRAESPDAKAQDSRAEAPYRGSIPQRMEGLLASHAEEGGAGAGNEPEERDDAPENDPLAAEAELGRGVGADGSLGEFELTYYVTAREPEAAEQASPATGGAAPAEAEERADGGEPEAEERADGGEPEAEERADGGEPEVGEAVAHELPEEEGDREARAADSGDRLALRDAECERIADVDAGFAEDLRMQGSGVLRDGRLVSAHRECACAEGGLCFFVTDEDAEWGIGAAGRELAPFRSVAVDPDVVSLGQTLYIRELDGVRMPGEAPWGGFVHDGCVVADDRGGLVEGAHLDFFAARRGYYEALLHAHGLTRVTVYEGEERCGDDPREVRHRSS